jgi:hypothetical protein
MALRFGRLRGGLLLRGRPGAEVEELEAAVVEEDVVGRPESANGAELSDA